MTVGLTYVKSAVREIFVIYTVGHLFGLKAEHILQALGISTLEGVRLVVQKVAGIELNTRLIGVDLHNSAALRLINVHARLCHGVFPLCEIDAVIVAACKCEGLV